MLLLMTIVINFKLLAIITKGFILNGAGSSFQLCFADTLEWKAFDKFLWKYEKYEKHFQHMKILIYLRHLLIWKKIDENKNHSLEIISGSFWCVLSLRLLLRFNSAFNWEVMINLFNWCDMINLFNFAIKTVKTLMYIITKCD